MDNPDALISLRQSVALGITPLLTESSDPSAPSTDFAHAKYLHLVNLHGRNLSYPLDSATRFSSNDTPVDLRSIYFAYLQRDASAQDYIASTQRINEELGGASLKNLLFAERLDLNSWLGGIQDDSEHILPLPSSGAGAAVPSAELKGPKAFDARLQEIYKGERRTQDRYSILHGIKPTDFSSVRKQASALLYAARTGNKNPPKPTNPAAGTNSVNLPHNPRKPRVRQEPLILLSPSASALLRISNAPQFLENGVFTPPEGTDSKLLYIQRLMPSISAQPLRFLLAESLDSLKPDDWARLVAVFTTGQLWQFKSYKWSNPTELFSRALGVYVGWSGEGIPDAVKGWGRAVKCVSVEKWTPGHAAAVKSEGAVTSRWRDREVVESIWVAIEQSMRAKGWSKDLGYVPGNK
jgi:parafibromin